MSHPVKSQMGEVLTVYHTCIYNKMYTTLHANLLRSGYSIYYKLGAHLPFRMAVQGSDPKKISLSQSAKSTKCLSTTLRQFGSDRQAYSRYTEHCWCVLQKFSYGAVVRGFYETKEVHLKRTLKGICLNGLQNECK